MIRVTVAYTQMCLRDRYMEKEVGPHHVSYLCMVSDLSYVLVRVICIARIFLGVRVLAPRPSWRAVTCITIDIGEGASRGGDWY